MKIFLRRHGLEVFEFVRCSSKLLGKARMIRSVIRRQHVRAAEILFVGDETRDIEACQKVGVRIVAVTWGYNSRRSIVAMKPDFIFDDPKELVALLANQTAQPDGGKQSTDDRRRIARLNRTTALPVILSVSLASALQTGTASRSQISRAYSRMARSLENLPTRAVLRMAIRAQRVFSRKAASTFFWQSL